MGLLKVFGLPIAIMGVSSLLMPYTSGLPSPPPPGSSILASIRYCIFHRGCVDSFIALHIIGGLSGLFSRLETGRWPAETRAIFIHPTVSSLASHVVVFWAAATIIIVFQHHGWTGEQLFCRFADHVVARLKEARS